MQLGMIGLGRMGADMVRRLIRDGHACVVYDRSAGPVAAAVEEGAVGAASLAELVGQLSAPRAIWIMVPAAAVETVLQELRCHLQPGDIVIDGGNSHYRDDVRRSEQLQADGVAYLDVGTSGGVWGLERGYCLMIGGSADAVQQLEPVFKSLAPGIGEVERTPGREGLGGTAEEGYLHCGPSGAGHFVKMVHNGIEYGVMAAYAEGFNLLAHANVGQRIDDPSAETAPMANPQHYRYEVNLADVAEVWRRGSVIASWLLDLAAAALAQDPQLDGFAGRVSDSGEGRWTVMAAIETGSPVPVLSSALFERFTSRGEADVADRLLSAMRYGFGGHLERRQGGGGAAT